MQNFNIQKKIGKWSIWAKINRDSWFLGDGSFSQVYRVKRISDGEEYALKKVSDRFRHKIWKVVLTISTKTILIISILVRLNTKF
jgi:serine/threonine protein kinase